MKLLILMRKFFSLAAATSTATTAASTAATAAVTMFGFNIVINQLLMYLIKFCAASNMLKI